MAADSGKDSELYSREMFHLYYTYYASFLCQDTKFLLLWFTPIYSFKFFILLYGTDTTLLMRGKLYFAALSVAIFFHYLLTTRELKRFY